VDIVICINELVAVYDVTVPFDVEYDTLLNEPNVGGYKYIVIDAALKAGIER